MLKSTVITFLLLTASIYTVFAVSDSLRTETIDGKLFIIHEVDQGETLYALGRRYSTSADQLSKENDLVNYTISVGQILRVPIKEVKMTGIFHTVDQGETLYSISRAYEVSIDELKLWNHLVDNNLSIGQKLSIGSQMPDTADLYADETVVEPAEDIKENKETEKKAPEVEMVKETVTPSFTYYVQTGESLATIADKFKVSADSIRYWNNLSSRRVNIGQSIIFPFEVDIDSVALNEKKPDFRETTYGSKYKIDEDGGVKKLYEEGIAKVINSQINSTKYLALHRTLSVGTVFQVKNMMNNQTIYVRVVGKLPSTGINEGTMVRLTPKAFERLGIIDEKALVGITYFDE